MEKELFDDQLIVVTGAAGMIGSSVVRHLNDQGYTNLLLVDDIDDTDKWKNLLGKQFVELVSRRDLFSFIDGREKEIEAWIHLGAFTDTRAVNGEKIIQNNYQFSIDIAEYALENDHRFIYASSAATYGNGQEGFIDDEEQLDRLKPLNLYGFSKHLFDQWVKRQGVLDRVVGLKYFNIFGPNEWHKKEMSSMVLHFFDQIQTRGKVSLFQSSDPDRYADGEQKRDFYYVKDVARLTTLFLRCDINGIFNIGSGKATTWKELAQLLFQTLNKKVNIEYILMPERLISQYQNYTKADRTKLEKEMRKHGVSFEDQFSLPSAIEDYVHNHLLTGERW